MDERKLAVQIFSDLHLELWNKIPEISVKSKYLLLPGDICNISHPQFFTFLDYCSINWKYVFYVPGNHEYYVNKKCYTELSQEYSKKIREKYKNVYWLDNDFIFLEEEDINIYGTTFWTPPPFGSKYQARAIVNDYKSITYFNEIKGYREYIDLNHVQSFSNESFNKLQNYLNDTTKKTIVITHFPPNRTGTSDPRFLEKERLINSYFAWSDDTLSRFKTDNVLCWISGHTHWSYDFVKDGIRLISNQLGYKSEAGTTGLIEEGVFEITIS